MSIEIGWPQAIFLFLQLIGMGVALARYGENKQGKYNTIDTLIAPAILFGLLYWGGFFSP